jgi:hypothetical protein
MTRTDAEPLVHAGGGLKHRSSSARLVHRDRKVNKGRPVTPDLRVCRVSLARKDQQDPQERTASQVHRASVAQPVRKERRGL